MYITVLFYSPLFSFFFPSFNTFFLIQGGRVARPLTSPRPLWIRQCITIVHIQYLVQTQSYHLCTRFWTSWGTLCIRMYSFAPSCQIQANKRTVKIKSVNFRIYVRIKFTLSAAENSTIEQSPEFYRLLGIKHKYCKSSNLCTIQRKQRFDFSQIALIGYGDEPRSPPHFSCKCDLYQCTLERQVKENFLTNNCI